MQRGSPCRLLHPHPPIDIKLQRKQRWTQGFKSSIQQLGNARSDRGLQHQRYLHSSDFAMSSMPSSDPILFAQHLLFICTTSAQHLHIHLHNICYSSHFQAWNAGYFNSTCSPSAPHAQHLFHITYCTAPIAQHLLLSTYCPSLAASYGERRDLHQICSPPSPPIHITHTHGMQSRPSLSAHHQHPMHCNLQRATHRQFSPPNAIRLFGWQE